MLLVWTRPGGFSREQAQGRPHGRGDSGDGGQEQEIVPVPERVGPARHVGHELLQLFGVFERLHVGDLQQQLGRAVASQSHGGDEVDRSESNLCPCRDTSVDPLAGCRICDEFGYITTYEGTVKVRSEATTVHDVEPVAFVRRRHALVCILGVFLWTSLGEHLGSHRGVRACAGGFLRVGAALRSEFGGRSAVMGATWCEKTDPSSTHSRTHSRTTQSLPIARPSLCTQAL